MLGTHTILIMSSPEELRPFLRRVRHRRTFFAGEKSLGLSKARALPGWPCWPVWAATAPRLPGRTGHCRLLPPIGVLVAGFGGALTALPPPGGILLAAECWRLAPDGPSSRVDFQPVAPPDALASLLQARGLAGRGRGPADHPRPDGQSLLALPGLPPAPAGAGPGNRRSRRRGPAHNLPFLAVRAITDGAGEEIHDFLADLINQYQGVPLSRLLPALWADPRRVGYCVHLWRRSRLAGQTWPGR